MKKFWRVISSIFVWLVVIVAVLTMVFTIVSVRTFNNNERSIFGYRFYIFLSDSMSASGYNAGDLAVVKIVDPSTLQPGDVISYQSQNAESYGSVVTHEIRTLTRDASGNPGFITYGTTTGTDDETVVTYPFVMGKLQISLPKVGTFFHYLKTPQGYLVCILLPFLLLIGYQGLNCIKTFRRYKREQMQELQQEKEQLEADRKRSDEMMAQLLAIQQQMAAQQAATTAAPPVQQPVVAAQEPAAAPGVVSEQAAAPAQQPDVAAMMAELEMLRAQLAAQQEGAQPKVDEEKKDSDNQ